jgi:hypothetical protein
MPTLDATEEQKLPPIPSDDESDLGSISSDDESDGEEVALAEAMRLSCVEDGDDAAAGDNFNESLRAGIAPSIAGINDALTALKALFARLLAVEKVYHHLRRNSLLPEQKGISIIGAITSESSLYKVFCLAAYFEKVVDSFTDSGFLDDKAILPQIATLEDRVIELAQFLENYAQIQLAKGRVDYLKLEENVARIGSADLVDPALIVDYHLMPIPSGMVGDAAANAVPFIEGTILLSQEPRLGKLLASARVLRHQFDRLLASFEKHYFYRLRDDSASILFLQYAALKDFAFYQFVSDELVHVTLDDQIGGERIPKDLQQVITRFQVSFQTVKACRAQFINWLPQQPVRPAVDTQVVVVEGAVEQMIPPGLLAAENKIFATLKIMGLEWPAPLPRLKDYILRRQATIEAYEAFAKLIKTVCDQDTTNLLFDMFQPLYAAIKKFLGESKTPEPHDDLTSAARLWPVAMQAAAGSDPEAGQQASAIYPIGQAHVDSMVTAEQGIVHRVAEMGVGWPLPRLADYMAEHGATVSTLRKYAVFIKRVCRERGADDFLFSIIEEPLYKKIKEIIKACGPAASRGSGSALLWSRPGMSNHDKVGEIADWIQKFRR